MTWSDHVARHGRTATAAGLVMLALGVVLGSVVLTAPRAHATEPIEIVAAFEDLVPGEPQARAVAYELDADARLSGFAWGGREGILRDAELGVEVCGLGDVCMDATRPSAQIFPAGPIQVTVTVTLAQDAATASAGGATGRLTFTADSTLPITGPSLLAPLTSALALTLSGVALLALVLVGRRREPASPITVEQ